MSGGVDFEGREAQRADAAKHRTHGGSALTDVLAFLNSLTDDALLHDPRFADRWTQAAQETR